MKKLLMIFSFFITLSLSCLVVSADVTMDNNGEPRDNPYGDSKIQSSFGSDVAYYDCYIPYSLTVEEVGGYAVTASNAVSATYKPMPDYVKSWKVGTRPSWESSKKAKSIKNCTMTFEEDTNMQIYTDTLGNQYYATAIQHFFYNNSTVGTNGFPGWGMENRGQIFDIILTDGTVIHFIVTDANAIQHTNGGENDSEGVFDVKYGFSKLNYPQYAHIYGATAGNCLELWSKNSSDVNNFLRKYNIGKEDDKNKIAYYRMYNKDVDDGIKRADGIGKEVSYNLGEVSISNSNNSENKDSLGNSIKTEFELRGMKEFEKKVSDGQEDVEMAKREDLSIGEQYSVSMIGSDISIQKRALSIDNARVAVVFVGLCMIFYGVLLCVSVLFDRSNNFIDISLVKIITFGVVTYSEEEGTKGKKGYASSGRIVFIIVVVVIIGCLLVSGGVLPFMMDLINSIIDKFNTIR